MITSVLSTFTSAPITPRAVSLKYSNGFDLFTVFKKGYKNIGIWAFKNYSLVSLLAATLWNNAKTLQVLFDYGVERLGGARS